MNSATRLEDLDQLTKTDRRSTRRYPITLQLRYMVPFKERFGLGRTLDVSSRGVLFEAREWVPAKTAIELSLYWPFRLQDACELQLVMRGRVVRQDGRNIAVHSDFHEFRTVGRGSHRQRNGIDTGNPGA